MRLAAVTLLLVTLMTPGSVLSAPSATDLAGAWSMKETVKTNTCDESNPVGTVWAINLFLQVKPDGEAEANVFGNTSWTEYKGATTTETLVLDGESSGNRSNYNLKLGPDGLLTGTRTVSFKSACTLIAEVSAKRLTP